MQNDEAGCATRHAHVTCANFSRQGEIVATYNDEVMFYTVHTALAHITCIASRRQRQVGGNAAGLWSQS